MIWLPLCAVAGAFLYRWRGGPHWLGGPRWLKLGACAAFLCLPLSLQLADWLSPAWDGGLLLLAFLAAFGALSLGHGAYMDLAHTQPEKPHDRVGAYQEEPWLAWLARLTGGTLAGSRYWYEFLALGVTGFVATLGPGIALAVGHVGGDVSIGALFLVMSGWLKAVAYAIGWRVAAGSRATEVGEWLTGGAMGLGVGLALG